MSNPRHTVAGWLRTYGIDWRRDRPRSLDVVSPDLIEVRHPGWRHRRAFFLAGLMKDVGTSDSGRRREETAARSDAEALLRVAQRNHEILEAAKEHPDVPWWPQPMARFAYEEDDAAWLVSGEIASVDGRPVIWSLTIEPNHVAWRDGEPGLRRVEEMPTAGVTSNALRSVPLGRVLASIKQELADAERWAQASQDLTPSIPVTRWDRLSARALTKVFRGDNAHRLPDEFYRAVAIGYLEEQGAGRGVYRRLGDRLAKYRPDGAPIPAETLRTWVRVAEQRGFLTAGTRGRSDRQPGPALIGRKAG